MMDEAKTELYKWVKRFTRPMRGRPEFLILDEVSSEYFLLFDFSDAPETPEAKDTCDIGLVPLLSDDFIADSIRIAANVNKFGVLRLLGAMSIRYNETVKALFYEMSPLREQHQ